MVKLDLDLFDSTDMGDFLPMTDVKEVKRRCVLQARTFLSLYTLQTKNLIDVYNASPEQVEISVSGFTTFVNAIETQLNDINALKLLGILLIDINEELLQSIHFDDNDTEGVVERLKCVRHILAGDVNPKALVKKLKKMKEIEDGLRVGENGESFLNKALVDDIPILEVANINDISELRNRARNYAKLNGSLWISYTNIVDGTPTDDNEEATYTAVLYNHIDKCTTANELKAFCILCIQLNNVLSDSINLGTDAEMADRTMGLFSELLMGNIDCDEMVKLTLASVTDEL